MQQLFFVVTKNKQRHTQEALIDRIGAHQLGKSPKRRRGMRRIASAAPGLDDVGERLRERFNPNEYEQDSPHRKVFVIQFDDRKMIRAFEDQLLHRFGAGAAQSIRKASRVERETGKLLERVENQKRRRIGPDKSDRRSLVKNL